MNTEEWRYSSKYSWVSFCDGSFYDDSLLLSLPRRTEHSRFVVYHCGGVEILLQIQLGLVLRRFVLRRFTFTIIAETDRALPICGASLWRSGDTAPNTVGSRFTTVRFTTIHFYDHCRDGLSTPDLWCITVATQATFIYSVHF